MNAIDGKRFLSDFEKACKDENQEITVDSQICGGSGASKKFLNLDTEEEVIRFIGNNGLVNPSFLKAEEWRFAPALEKPCLAYSYLFESGNIKGYLSIAYKSKRKIWHLKSFKEHALKRHKKAMKGSKKSLQ